MLPSHVRFVRVFVFRTLVISALIASLFAAGCTTGNSEAQLAIATLQGGLPMGSVSVGGGAYPPTTITATGGTAPYAFAVTSGSLPTGLALSATGTISGSPTTAGPFTFTVTVTDSATMKHTTSASFTITINGPLTITTTGTLAATGEAGAVYPATALSETGGVGPFTFALNSPPSSLPGGLTLSSAGSISGTISASAVPGTFNFVAKVTDSQGNVVTSGTISIKVDPALVITPPTFPAGIVGVSYPPETFTATGGSGTGYTFALASGTLPSSLTLNGNGTIATGMLTTAGTYTFTVKVTDSLGFTVTTGNLSITVNQTPAITTNPANQTVTVGGNASFTAAASGIPAPTVQWQVSANGGAFTNVSGATSATLALTAVTAAMNGNRYQAVFTNTAGNATTTAATLTVVPAPVITSFTAGAATITAGTSTTLTGVFSNGTGSVNNSVGAVTSGTAVNVTPVATTMYTLTVTNAAGTSVTQQATVTVVPAPVITSFTAGAATITAGTSTTLTAMFSNGTGSVDHGVGAVTSGTPITISPSVTTTYTLTVTNAATTPATTTATTMVTVVAAPVITSFTPGAATITVGNSTTLTAVFSNGTGSVDHGVGAVTSGTPVNISPSTTTTYTLTVTNAATTPATATATTTVTVDTPPAITSGTSATFTVGVNGTFTVTATGTPTPTLSESGTLPPGVMFTAATGILSGTPGTGSAGPYPITFTAQNGITPNATQNFTLTVVLTAPPVITTNPANQTVTVGNNASFTAAASGGPAPTVQWQVSTNNGVTFTNVPGATSPTLALTAVTAAMNGNRYQAVFTNTLGNATTMAATLTVVPAPVITSFTAAAPTITAGTSTTLTGMFSNGTGSVNNGVGAVTSGTAASTGTLTASTTFTLTVTNAAGTSVTANATVTVVPAPVITSFTAGAATIIAGTSTTLTGAFSNGIGSVNNGVGTVTSGTAVTIAPTTTTTYTLTVTNAAGTSATAMATVTVNSPPAITSANHATFILNTQGSFTVTATGSPAPAITESGILPTGVSFDTTTHVLSGTPTQSGTFPLVFTAHNGVGSDFIQNFTLTVNVGPPTISTSVVTQNPFFAGDPATTITITVINDVPGDVITAALTVDANTSFNCTTATCGTLGAVTPTTPGNYTVSYMPPASAGFIYQTVPTIVVSSNQTGSIGATDFIEVDPAGILVTIDTVARQGTVYVGANPADTRTLNVTIYNDTTHQGVTFLPLTASGYACATLSTNSCGTLGAPSTPVYTGNTGTITIPYTPPASLPSAPYDKPRIEAVSVHDPTRIGSTAFELRNNPVTGGPPSTMWISRNSIFKTASIGTAQTVTARVLNDTGPNQTVNWTLTASGLNCSTTCGTLGTPTATVTATAGGPRVDSTITYTPPLSVPSGSSAQPTITATSADTPSETDSFTFNIIDPTCGTGHESVLNGHYAFLLRGGAAGGGYVTLIGSFMADGTGKITSGLLDINGSLGSILDLTLLTAPMGSLPASSYSVGADNRGCLTLTDSAGQTSDTYRFSVGTVVSGVATEGRIILFDDTTWRNRQRSGVLMKQDPTSFNAGAFSANYAFGLVGVGDTGGRLESAGVLTTNGTGTISNIIIDANEAGSLNAGGESARIASQRPAGAYSVRRLPLTASHRRTTTSSIWFRRQRSSQCQRITSPRVTWFRVGSSRSRPAPLHRPRSTVAITFFPRRDLAILTARTKPQWVT